MFFTLQPKSSVDFITSLVFWRIFTCGNRKFCPAGIEVPVEARNKKNKRKIIHYVVKSTR